MAFNYYSVYRAVSSDREFPALRGAAQLEDNRWAFYGFDEDYPPVRYFDFEAMHLKKDGRVIGWTTVGDKFEFTKVTLEELKKDPSLYGLSADEQQFVSNATDMTTLMIQMDIPEWYVEMFGPPEEQADFQPDFEDEAILGEELLSEKRGVKAAVGDIHIWKDGNAYQKGSDGGWRRVQSDWADEDTEGLLPKDTKEHYFSQKEGWNESRREVHEALIAPMFEGKEPADPDTKPQFSFVMGPPAAGKTTFVEGETAYGDAVVLDPDAILQGLPEFQTGMKKKIRSAAKVVHTEARMVNDLALQKAIDGRFHITLPGSGDDLNWIQNDLFPRLVKAGYTVNLVMPFVDDLDELLFRSEARGEHTGRFVPTDRIIDLYDRLPKNFMALMDDPRVTSASVYRTSTKGGGEDRRRGPTEVFMRIRDEEGQQDDLVSNEEAWKEFQSLSSKDESIAEQRKIPVPKGIAQHLDQVKKLLAADMNRMDKTAKKYKPGSGAVDLLPGRLTLPYDPRA